MVFPRKEARARERANERASAHSTSLFLSLCSLEKYFRFEFFRVKRKAFKFDNLNLKFESFGCADPLR